MDTNSLAVRPIFYLRLGVAVLSFIGFWVCLARVESPTAVSLKGPGLSRVVPASPASADSTVPEGGGGPAGSGSQEVDPVVMIDPGHGGLDGGTVGNGLLEKDWTLKIGLALAVELRARGHQVALTREADETLPLMDRPAVVNAAARVALLSIHFNAGTVDASGVETWYSWPKKPETMARLHDAAGVPVAGVLPDDGQRLALAIQAAVQSSTGARDRGIKNREDLAMTSRTICPAVLIECGFLSNAAESRKIQEAGYRKKMVQGIANGYEDWLKNRWTVPAVPVVVAPPSAVSGADAEH